MNQINLFIQRIWTKQRVIPALIILAGLGAVILTWQPARVHALLDRAFPEPNSELTEPPRMLELFFTEPLESGFSSIRMIDSQGAEITIGPSVVDPADPTRMTADLSLLAPGIYTVAWQTLSQVDGHEWFGSYPFTVLNPDGSRPSGSAASVAGGTRGELPSLVEVLARWVGLVGGALVFGAAVFMLAVVFPALQVEADAPGAFIEKEAARLAWLMIWLGVIALLLGGWVGIANQALRLEGLIQVPGLLLGTRTGTLVLSRTVLAFNVLLVVLSRPQPRPLEGRERLLTGIAGVGFGVGALMLAWRALQGDMLALALVVPAAFGLGLAFWARQGQRIRPRVWQSLALLGLPILLTFSLGNHAGAAEGSVWAVLGDFIHMAAAAAWVGGLVLLGSLLVQTWRAGPELSPGLLLAPLLRFSKLAGAAVFLVIATGLFSSLVELPSPQSLFTTAYGRVLLLKLVLVAFALLIALYNNRVLHRKVEQLKTERGELRFQRRVVVEMCVSLAILLAVAVLVQTPAPRPLAQDVVSVAPELPFNTLSQADDLFVHLKVSPNEVGENAFWLHLYHADGSPIGEVQLVRLTFDYAQADLGSSQIELESSGLDVFEQTGANLSQAGSWDVSVYIRRRGMDDVIGDLFVDVRSASGTVGPRNPWGNPVPGLPPIMVAGGALVLVGLVPLVWGRPDGAIGRKRLPLTLAGDLAIFLGVTLLIGGLVGIFLAARLNPGRVPPSAESIAAGEMLYIENCVVCHGDQGRGDGPLGLTLQPPPAILQAHVPLHVDEKLYGFIAQGFPNTAMRGFEEELSTSEIWHLVNYLRDQYGGFALDPQP